MIQQEQEIIQTNLDGLELRCHYGLVVATCLCYVCSESNLSFRPFELFSYISILFFIFKCVKGRRRESEAGKRCE
jgi:hypothetical protein